MGIKTELLCDVSSGKSGKIIEILGGTTLERRLAALGVRVNMKLKKIGGQMFKGPVVLKVGRTTLAIAHGMASKILVEVDK